MMMSKFFLCFLWCCAMIVYEGEKILKKVVYSCVQCQNGWSSKEDLRKLGSKYYLQWNLWFDIQVRKTFKEAQEESTLNKSSDQRGCPGISILAQCDPLKACLALP